MSKDVYSIIKYPLTTEKSVKYMEQENKLMFIVDKKANKTEIREAVEKMFKIRVVSVNTTILNDGRKKAYVRLAKENNARDLITQMGLA
ncbi:50S ribosomal protein L23 [Candidatus Woesearchaeota archaeon]|nr:50S ribosomal protein L23 [Candidatus Woesearchaeota archaeon]